MAKRCTQSSELRWFQFKIIHNILITNNALFKMRYVDSPVCSSCEDAVEMIVHVLYNCQYSKNIWRQLAGWIENYVEGKCEFNEENILFGFRKRNNNSLNAIILIRKSMLYKCNTKKIKPTFIHLQKEIISYYQATKNIAFSNCNYAKFHAFWSSLLTLFKS